MTAAAALLIAAAATYGGDAAHRDCAPGAVHADVDGQPLTREEKIARLDEALRESLARFDECQTATSAAVDAPEGVEGAQGGTAGDGNGAPGQSVAAQGGDSEADESAQADGPVESVAATDVQGTEAPEDAESTGPDTTRPGDPDGTHPGIPDDIPGPDNDSVLEAQIRRAAMEETDPRIRAELWNEYRKYKGLPPRPLPDDDGEPSDAQNSE